MNIQITGRQIEMTQAIKDYVAKRFKKLERHCDHLSQIQVILSVRKNRHFAEARIHIPHHEIFAEQESDDMYSAIDLLTDKLKRQLSKQKEKDHDHSGIDKRAMNDAYGEEE
jgi:putative sigma-54 modulation protein